MPTPKPHPTPLDPATRAWLYRVVLAVLPILAAYGLLTDTDLALWGALAAAVLSTGVATAHSPGSP